MKKFETPAVDVEVIEVEDVITASGNNESCTFDCGNGSTTFTGDL